MCDSEFETPRYDFFEATLGRTSGRKERFFTYPNREQTNTAGFVSNGSSLPIIYADRISSEFYLSTASALQTERVFLEAVWRHRTETFAYVFNTTEFGRLRSAI